MVLPCLSSLIISLPGKSDALFQGGRIHFITGSFRQAKANLGIIGCKIRYNYSMQHRSCAQAKIPCALTVLQNRRRYPLLSLHSDQAPAAMFYRFPEHIFIALRGILVKVTMRNQRKLIAETGGFQFHGVAAVKCTYFYPLRLAGKDHLTGGN